MPGANGQNYGSEQPDAGKEGTVAANQLDGLQWGKSGLEMDEERKQQVFICCHKKFSALDIWR